MERDYCIRVDSVTVHDLSYREQYIITNLLKAIKQPHVVYLSVEGYKKRKLK